MTHPEKLLVAMATYNEIDNLPSLVGQVFDVVPEADLLVVDDNSPDGTGRWVDAQAASDPRIRGLHRARKMGLGSATVAALEYAIRHEYTFVLALDADGSHDPPYIPEMLARMREGRQGAPDIVIGSRYVPGGSTVGWPFYRRWMSRGVNAFARTMLGIPVRDCSSAFRCMRVDMLRRVDLATFHSQGYSFFEEFLWRFKLVGARFEEVPIVFINRERGKSKINARESLVALWTLFRLGLRNRFRVSP